MRLCRTGSRRVNVSLIASCLWLLPAALHASEETHHAHEGIPWATLLFATVNFLLFCWILARYLLPVARDYARNRHARIVEDLEAAAKARADAEQLKAQWEARLAALDEEIKDIRAQAVADGTREREQILVAAQRTAEAIQNDARRAAAQEVRRAETELRLTVAREATALASQLLRERLDPKDQERFIAEFLIEVKP